jgi:hypothetical protein
MPLVYMVCIRSPSHSLVVSDLLLLDPENARLCLTMDVSGPASTRLMMMSRFGWQCSQSSLCKYGFPPFGLVAPSEG